MAYTTTDIFNHNSLPAMVNELSILDKGVAHLPVYFKAEIIISYLKSHSIQNDWIAANPALVKVLLSHSFITKNIESEFELCRALLLYRHDYEKYITLFLNSIHL